MSHLVKGILSKEKKNPLAWISTTKPSITASLARISCCCCCKSYSSVASKLMEIRHRQSFFSHSEGLRSIQNLFCFFFFLPSSICLPTFFEIFPELKLLYCEFSSIPSFASFRFAQVCRKNLKEPKNRKFCRFFRIFFAFSTKIVFEHSLKNSKNSRERSNFSLQNWKKRN